MYYLLLPSPDHQQSFIEYLRSNNIGAVFHYVPLHNSGFMREYLSIPPVSLPVTEDIARRLVRLPLWIGMLPEVGKIVKVIEKYFKSLG